MPNDCFPYGQARAGIFEVLYDCFVTHDGIRGCLLRMCLEGLKQAYVGFIRRVRVCHGYFIGRL